MQNQNLSKNLLKWSSAVLGAGLMACGLNGGLPYDDSIDWSTVDFDDPLVEGIPELALPVSGVTTNCVYGGTDNKTVRWEVPGGETVIFSKRSIDGALLANGKTCAKDTTAGTVVSVDTDLKYLDIWAAAGDNETVILDFINGRFASGASGKPGITVNLDDGTDTLKIRGTTGADDFRLSPEGIYTSTDSQIDITNTYSGSDMEDLSAIVVSLVSGSDRFTAQTAADNNTVFSADTLTVYGGDGSDFLYGSDGNDTIEGGDNNDRIRGHKGNDVLKGNDGDDTFEEDVNANGNDQFFGGDGHYKVDYSDRLGAINVNLQDAAGDGRIGTDNATISALTGDGTTSTFTLGATTNFKKGESFTVTGCTVTTALNKTHLITAVSGDNISFAFDNGSAVADNCSITGHDESDQVVSGSTGNSGNSIEEVVGGSGDDTLTGSTDNETLRGGAGDDTLYGYAGDDTLYGDNGDDFIDERDNATSTSASGKDYISGGQGSDTVSYSLRAGNISVEIDNQADDGEDGEDDNVRSDVENVIGGAGNDNITGSTAANQITGGMGDDILNGGSGDDTFYERTTDNTTDTGADNITGGTGSDWVIYLGSTDDVTIDLRGTDNTTDNTGTTGEKDNLFSCENAQGPDNNTRSTTIHGNDSDNILYGGAGADTIHGYDGDDYIDSGDNASDNVTCGDGQGDIYIGGDNSTSDCEL